MTGQTKRLLNNRRCDGSTRWRPAVFAHFRDGLIVEAWEIVDTSSLLRQLGTAD